METRQPLDPDFESKVRDSFARQGFMALLGARLVEIKAGACSIEVPFTPEVAQQHGFFHAGVTGAIADSACGYAAFSLMARDHSVLSVEYKLNLVAPAEGNRIIARAEVVRSGKTLSVCEAKVFVVKEGREKLCAASLSTIMAMSGKADR